MIVSLHDYMTVDGRIAASPLLCCGQLTHPPKTMVDGCAHSATTRPGRAQTMWPVAIIAFSIAMKHATAPKLRILSSGTTRLADATRLAQIKPPDKLKKSPRMWMRMRMNPEGRASAEMVGASPGEMNSKKERKLMENPAILG